MQQYRPIFVGGTGRSGSTVVGYLIGSHPDVWATKPRELRILTDAGGLLDLVYGYSGRVRPNIDPTLHGASRVKSWVVQTRMTKLKHVPVSPATFMRDMYGPWGPEHGFTVRFDQLLHTRRDATLHALFAFLGYDVTPEVQSFFDERMSGHKANTNRWTRDIPADEMAGFERRYREMHEELTALGLDLPPI